ncbi:MAG TPA: O-antigen ligase family protein, partial [Gemmatimonadaceae bacterium]
ALLLIAVDPSTGGRLRAAWALPGIRWLFALLAWATLSSPLALWPHGAMDIVVNSLVKGIAMVIAIIVSVRGLRDIRRLAIVFFIGVVIFSVVVMSRFDIEPATERFSQLVYYDANEFALLAAASLPFGAYAAWLAPTTTRRIVVLGAMALVFEVFVFCGSRGAVLALAAGLLYTMLSLRTIKLRWRVLAIVVVVGSFLTFASDQFWERMDDAVESQDDYNITSPTGRLQVWKRGIEYMVDNPVLGVGAGNFSTAEGKLSSYAAMLRERNAGYKWSVAHNSYVQAGAELGVPGLVFFTAALFGTVLAVRRLTLATRGTPRHPELVALANASVVSLIVFAVGATFLSLAYSDMLFALLALAMGVLVASRRPR